MVRVLLGCYLTAVITLWASEKVRDCEGIKASPVKWTSKTLGIFAFTGCYGLPRIRLFLRESCGQLHWAVAMALEVNFLGWWWSGMVGKPCVSSGFDPRPRMECHFSLLPWVCTFFTAAGCSR